MLPVLFSVLHPELPVQVRFPTLPYPLQLTGHPESFLLSDPEEPVFREMPAEAEPVPEDFLLHKT